MGPKSQPLDLRVSQNSPQDLPKLIGVISLAFISPIDQTVIDISGRVGFKGFCHKRVADGKTIDLGILNHPYGPGTFPCKQ